MTTLITGLFSKKGVKMSTNGYFEIEEGDIVRLVDADHDGIRTGWVNVGPHALYIHYDPETQNLRVESKARTNEGESLGSFSVSGQEAREAGGEDPDVDDFQEQDAGPAEGGGV